MTPLEHYVGQILDDKYRLERLLGQGGMGAVYLATHLGTERYVALKLIAPQFMRNEEFVERFKREARAAGRLRHPNVVDVTDFGFSSSRAERVAYLVMEYLDGCTLSDVLFEENRLPLYWVVDILEQVCSAVHEAHQQGIVHRDLKPDNIWLEPNGLGGYRIKVLDFGIAKLGETASVDVEHLPASDSAEDTATLVPSSRPIAATAAAAEIGKTIAAPLENLEAATLIHPSTASEEPAEDQADNGDQATRMFQRARSTVAEARLTALPLSNLGGDTGLTRVGAINYLGAIMVIVVVRELGPLLTVLLVLARIGTANVIELGTARAMGEVEALEALGIDPTELRDHLVGQAVAEILLVIVAAPILEGKDGEDDGAGAPADVRDDPFDGRDEAVAELRDRLDVFRADRLANREDVLREIALVAR